MKSALCRRVSLLVWLFIPAAAAVIYFIPVSNRFTKVCALVVALVVWRGLFSLTWPYRRLRWVLPGITVLAAVFLLMPERREKVQDSLRPDYTNALRAYEGTSYSWGGESRRGIDCSGLIRCGMINALARRGVLSGNGGLVRRSLSMWWNDTSAKALGEEYAGQTRLLFETPSINKADHSRLLPGDLAVTSNGVHILAYLGDGEWTQASPNDDLVITKRVPSDDSWYRIPVKLLRWEVLAGD